MIYEQEKIEDFPNYENSCSDEARWVVLVLVVLVIHRLQESSVFTPCQW